MNAVIFKRIWPLFLGLSAAYAQTSPSTPNPKGLPTLQQTVEVTATRVPEDPKNVPAAIEVFSGDELSAQGARDLRSALALATGVEIAPGGDSGPASSVPDFWGLKEFDAFLLVVDGVPWGGAFNPALTALNLSDIDRIEVLRGPAPVMYGATSFVGVIQVVHKSADDRQKTLDLHGGSYGSGGGAFSSPVPLWGDWASRLTLEGEREGFSDPRTSFRRGHGLWRVARKPTASNREWLNADLNWLDQDPASPRPLLGTGLTPLVPGDANQNMAGAFLNDHRGTVTAGFDRAVGSAQWSTSASVSRDAQDDFRGFLTDIGDDPDNAHGFREKIYLTDFYLDSHFSRKLLPSVRFLFGGDYLHGAGAARGADFDYTAPLNGAFAPIVPSPSDLDFHIDDQRNFFGVYASAEWTPLERLRFDGGVRLNITQEHQQVVDGGAGTNDQQGRTDTRPGTSLGAIFTAWQRKQDSVGLYVNYRDTFKPAAIDFGIGEEGGGPLILKPETSQSIEGGLKGRFLDRRMEAEASGFLMNFDNLVTATSVNGVPSLINSGKQRFQGFESGISYFFAKQIVLRGTYSFHDATFTDFVQDFNGSPVQLTGKRLQMSARNLAAVGVQYSPSHGFLGGLEVNYTGNQYLDMLNTALAGGFATFSLNAGYRTRHWELRVDVSNLTDRRDPVAESELGDSQFYLLPARRVDAGLRLFF
jgi:outer membrane receptor protein involved in Fe transport